MPATLIEFPMHGNENGILSVYECGKHVPFDVQRVFVVSAMAGDIRGEHAHRRCAQLLVCVSGKISVVCDDGLSVNQHLLDSMNCGLLVPPGIWAREEYVTDGAVLMVLCDQRYEAEDYIRDYGEFKNFIESER